MESIAHTKFNIPRIVYMSTGSAGGERVFKSRSLFEHCFKLQLCLPAMAESL